VHSLVPDGDVTMTCARWELRFDPGRQHAFYDGALGATRASDLVIVAVVAHAATAALLLAALLGSSDAATFVALAIAITTAGAPTTAARSRRSETT
jgi:hypothetical protein